MSLVAQLALVTVGDAVAIGVAIILVGDAVAIVVAVGAAPRDPVGCVVAVVVRGVVRIVDAIRIVASARARARVVCTGTRIIGSGARGVVATVVRRVGVI